MEINSITSIDKISNSTNNISSSSLSISNESKKSLFKDTLNSISIDNPSENKIDLREKLQSNIISDDNILQDQELIDSVDKFNDISELLIKDVKKTEQDFNNKSTRTSNTLDDSENKSTFKNILQDKNNVENLDIKSSHVFNNSDDEDYLNKKLYNKEKHFDNIISNPISVDSTNRKSRDIINVEPISTKLKNEKNTEINDSKKVLNNKNFITSEKDLKKEVFVQKNLNYQSHNIVQQNLNDKHSNAIVFDGLNNNLSIDNELLNNYVFPSQREIKRDKLVISNGINVSLPYKINENKDSKISDLNFLSKNIKELIMNVNLNTSFEKNNVTSNYIRKDIFKSLDNIESFKNNLKDVGLEFSDFSYVEKINLKVISSDKEVNFINDDNLSKENIIADDNNLKDSSLEKFNLDFNRKPIKNIINQINKISENKNLKNNENLIFDIKNTLDKLNINFTFIRSERLESNNTKYTINNLNVNYSYDKELVDNKSLNTLIDKDISLLKDVSKNVLFSNSFLINNSMNKSITNLINKESTSLGINIYSSSQNMNKNVLSTFISNSISITSNIPVSFGKYEIEFNNKFKDFGKVENDLISKISASKYINDNNVILDKPIEQKTLQFTKNISNSLDIIFKDTDSLKNSDVDVDIKSTNQVKLPLDVKDSDISWNNADVISNSVVGADLLSFKDMSIDLDLDSIANPLIKDSSFLSSNDSDVLLGKKDIEEILDTNKLPNILEGSLSLSDTDSFVLNVNTNVISRDLDRNDLNLDTERPVVDKGLDSFIDVIKDTDSLKNSDVDIKSTNQVKLPLDIKDSDISWNNVDVISDSVVGADLLSFRDVSIDLDSISNPLIKDSSFLSSNDSDVLLGKKDIEEILDTNKLPNILEGSLSLSDTDSFVLNVNTNVISRDLDRNDLNLDTERPIVDKSLDSFIDVIKDTDSLKNSDVDVDIKSTNPVKLPLDIKDSDISWNNVDVISDSVVGADLLSFRDVSIDLDSIANPLIKDSSFLSSNDSDVLLGKKDIEEILDTNKLPNILEGSLSLSDTDSFVLNVNTNVISRDLDRNDLNLDTERPIVDKSLDSFIDVIKDTDSLKNSDVDVDIKSTNPVKLPLDIKDSDDLLDMAKSVFKDTDSLKNSDVDVDIKSTNQVKLPLDVKDSDISWNNADVISDSVVGADLLSFRDVSIDLDSISNPLIKDSSFLSSNDSDVLLGKKDIEEILDTNKLPNILEGSLSLSDTDSFVLNVNTNVISRDLDRNDLNLDTERPIVDKSLDSFIDVIKDTDSLKNSDVDVDIKSTNQVKLPLDVKDSDISWNNADVISDSVVGADLLSFKDMSIDLDSIANPLIKDSSFLSSNDSDVLLGKKDIEEILDTNKLPNILEGSLSLSDTDSFVLNVNTNVISRDLDRNDLNLDTERPIVDKSLDSFIDVIKDTDSLKNSDVDVDIKSTNQVKLPLDIKDSDDLLDMAKSVFKDTDSLKNSDVDVDIKSTNQVKLPLDVKDSDISWNNADVISDSVVGADLLSFRDVSIDLDSISNPLIKDSSFLSSNDSDVLLGKKDIEEILDTNKLPNILEGSLSLSDTDSFVLNVNTNVISRDLDRNDLNLDTERPIVDKSLDSFIDVIKDTDSLKNSDVDVDIKSTNPVKLSFINMSSKNLNMIIDSPIKEQIINKLSNKVLLESNTKDNIKLSINSPSILFNENKSDKNDVLVNKYFVINNESNKKNKNDLFNVNHNINDKSIINNVIGINFNTYKVIVNNVYNSGFEYINNLRNPDLTILDTKLSNNNLNQKIPKIESVSDISKRLLSKLENLRKIDNENNDDNLNDDVYIQKLPLDNKFIALNVAPVLKNNINFGEKENLIKNVDIEHYISKKSSFIGEITYIPFDSEIKIIPLNTDLSNISSNFDRDNKNNVFKHLIPNKNQSLEGFINRVISKIENNIQVNKDKKRNFEQKLIYAPIDKPNIVSYDLEHYIAKNDIKEQFLVPTNKTSLNDIFKNFVLFDSKHKSNINELNQTYDENEFEYDINNEENYLYEDIRINESLNNNVSNSFISKLISNFKQLSKNNFIESNEPQLFNTFEDFNEHIKSEFSEVKSIEIKQDKNYKPQGMNIINREDFVNVSYVKDKLESKDNKYNFISEQVKDFVNPSTTTTTMINSTSVIQAINQGLPIHFAQIPKVISEVLTNIKNNKPIVLNISLNPFNMGELNLSFTLTDNNKMSIAFEASTLAAYKAMESYFNNIKTIVKENSLILQELSATYSPNGIKPITQRDNSSNDSGSFSGSSDDSDSSNDTKQVRRKRKRGKYDDKEELKVDI